MNRYRYTVANHYDIKRATYTCYYLDFITTIDIYNKVTWEVKGLFLEVMDKDDNFVTVDMITSEGE